MLTSVEFSALVNEADASARSSPLVYTLRVASLAALGFGFLAGSVLLALALGVSLIVLVAVTKSGVWLAKLVWLPFAFAWVLSRSSVPWKLIRKLRRTAGRPVFER